MNAYPLPQTSAIVNNIVTYPLKKSDDNRGDARVDYQITPSQTFFARYSIDDTQIQVPTHSTMLSSGVREPFRGRGGPWSKQGVLSYNKIITPHVVGDTDSDSTGPPVFCCLLLDISDFYRDSWKDTHARIPTAGSPHRGPLGADHQSIRLRGSGQLRSEPEIRRKHLWENIGNGSRERGRHNFKFGVDTLHHL